MPKISRNTIIYILVAVAVIAAGYMLCVPRGSTEKVSADDIKNLFFINGGYVSIENETIKAEIDGDKYEAVRPQDFDISVFTTREIGDGKLTIAYDDDGDSSGNWTTMVLTFLPIVLLGILLWVFLRRAQRRRNI